MPYAYNSDNEGATNGDDFPERPPWFDDAESSMEQNVMKMPSNIDHNPVSPRGDMTYEDESESDWTIVDTSEERLRRRARLAAIVLCCCCCLLLTGGGVAIGIIFPRDRGEDESPAPSTMPSMSPTTSQPSTTPSIYPSSVPSMQPSISSEPSLNPTVFIPEQAILYAVSDTFVTIAQPNTDFGNAQTLIVQSGLENAILSPISIAILSFSLDSMPTWQDLFQQDRTFSATLMLHKPISMLNRDASTIRVVRWMYPLEEGEAEQDDSILESITWTDFEDLHNGTNILEEATKYGNEEEFLLGSNFSVYPNNDTLSVDISDLLYSDFTLPTNPSLDYENATSSLFLKDKRPVVLLLINQGSPQIGDEFYSRESDSPCQLIMEFPPGNDTEWSFDPTFSPTQFGNASEISV